MATLSEALAKNLERLREIRGISQTALAAELGVSRQAVVKWESGSGGFTGDTISKLASHFGIEETDLVQPPRPAPSADLGDLIEYMRSIEWTQARLEVLRSVLTGFAQASEKERLESRDKLGKPGEKGKKLRT